MTTTDKIKNDVATRYNKVKNAPIYFNALGVITGLLLVLVSIVFIALKLIKFVLELIRYWIKGIMFVLRGITWTIDKLVPSK